MCRGFVRRVPIEHALLRRLRVEHAGLGAVELRPVVGAVCALDVGCRDAGSIPEAGV